VFSEEAVSLVQPSAENHLRPKEEPTRSNLQGVRVLLAEDCVDNQKLISHILVLFGATVVVVNNGEELLEQLTEVSGDTRVLRESLQFDLILTDIQMPLLDGYQVAKRLREIGFPSPIIAISANDSCEDQNRCLASGFSDYIEKPIKIDQFVRACRRCIPHLNPVGSEIGSESKGEKIFQSRNS
jgi:CheY-like chemotaxis protein